MEGRFVEEDVLYRKTFCMGGRSVEGRSVKGRSVEGRSVEGRSVEGHYVEGHLVGRTFCSGGRFVVVPRPG